jgi:hypothetical protein
VRERTLASGNLDVEETREEALLGGAGSTTKT